MMMNLAWNQLQLHFLLTYMRKTGESAEGYHQGIMKDLGVIPKSSNLLSLPQLQKHPFFYQVAKSCPFRALQEN